MRNEGSSENDQHLFLECGNDIAEAADGLTITVDYGQMGEKVYTMSAEHLAQLTK